MKGTALLVPPAVVILTRCTPRELSAGILNVAVNDVGFETRMSLTKIPSTLSTVVPVSASKYVPANVTDKVDPATALAGVIDTSVGGGMRTQNGAGPLVPASVLTVTSLRPDSASGEISNVARRLVLLVTVTLETRTPAPLTETVVPFKKQFGAAGKPISPRKAVPVRTTSTTDPAMPLPGEMEFRTGDALAELSATLQM
jgi:hypothetical protein